MPKLVGRASVALGAGRDRVEDAVDPAVGIMVRAAVGDEVRAGDPVLELHYRDHARSCVKRSVARGGDYDWRREAGRRGRSSSGRCIDGCSVRHSAGGTGPALAADRPGDRRGGGRAGGRGGARRADGRGAGAAARRRDRDPRDRLRLLDRSARDRPAHGRVGPQPADPLRADRPEDDGRPAGVLDARRRHQQAARLCRRGRRVRLRAARRQQRVEPRDDRRARAGRRALRRHLRVPGAADDHLHRGALRDSLLLRRHAGRRARSSPC